MSYPPMRADDPVTLQIVAMYREMSAVQIARRLDTTVSRVTRRLRLAGQVIRGAGTEAARWDDVVALEMESDGKTDGQIGRHFGVSAEAARHALMFAEGRVAVSRGAARRPCLRCRGQFPSANKGNRICAPCKGSDDWQHGVTAHRVVGARG